jgi:subtilisin-like proprotein convertase family protein
VRDGQYTTSTNFLVTLVPVNDPPVISSLASQTINVGEVAGPLAFTVSDVDTPVSNITVTARSSNPALVLGSNIVLGGEGSSRTVTVMPQPGVSGSATITLTANDGAASNSTSFMLTVSTLFIGTSSFTNAAEIVIPDFGAATPYPSSIAVSGLGGVVSAVTVGLRGLSHSWTPDITALLVSPDVRQAFVLINSGSGGASEVTLALFDAAGTALPGDSGLITGDYRPAQSFSTFTGAAPNGLWKLFVQDTGPGDQGDILDGWALTLTTVPGGVPAAPVVTLLSLTGNQLNLIITGDAGPPYTLQASSDLGVWTNLFTTNPSSLPFTCTVTNVGDFSQRFFRVLMGP